MAEKFEMDRQLHRMGNARVRFGLLAGEYVFELTVWDPATGKDPHDIYLPINSAAEFADELLAASAVLAAIHGLSDLGRRDRQKAAADADE